MGKCITRYNICPKGLVGWHRACPYFKDLFLYGFCFCEKNGSFCYEKNNIVPEFFAD
jgi:hypothetical protein